jgi:nickel-dependent lactate racemase
MAAAERIVADGGIIVLAAACVDGIPDHGAFAQVLAGARCPEDLIDAPGGAQLDRWQAQVLGRVLQRARVWIHSDGLTDALARQAQLRPVADLSAAVAAAVAERGPAARVAVLPEGPLTVATVTPVPGKDTNP